jgi:cholesterol oxidase
MIRLSLPNTGIKGSYDAVVVGSGYGGGAAASRLARAGLRVAVLERGKELVPGEYPDTIIEAQRELQIDAPGFRTGCHPTGLYDLRLNPDMNVLVGCGLGGTSLINANVSLAPDLRVFQDSCWPPEIREDNGGLLTEAFERAKRMLTPVSYPEKEKLSKLEALRMAGERLQHPATCPPINVTFEDRTNSAGVFQKACTLCGDCCSGCNVGAKNTTLMNYLPDARAHGAEIFCETGVRWLERGDAERVWRVHFRRLGPGQNMFDGEDPVVEARIVVLGAGALGSTEILLRSKGHGLPLSDEVGSRFSGNGDVLAFTYNNDIPIDGIGLGVDALSYRPEQSGKRPPGPTITGLIDLRDGPLDDGIIVEEGAIPGALGPLLTSAMLGAGAAFGDDTDDGFKDTVAERGRELESMLHGPYHGAVNHTQTLLVMAHDGAAGRLVLRDDRVRVDWPGVGQQPLYRRIAGRLRSVAEATGGTLVPNPMWTERLQHRLITVHPLGGCPMGASGADGVVDHACRVFAGNDGTVHDTLLVCDGSTMPRSLGVNPLLTITAVAERAMALLVAREGRSFDETAVQPGNLLAPAATAVGIRFTERMAGWFGPSTGADDFADAERRGRDSAAGTAEAGPLSFVATIVVDDLDRFINDPDHLAVLSGEVRAPGLSRDPLMVVDGRFNLFHVDPSRVETRRMSYAMPLVASDGTRCFLAGSKVIHDDRGFDVWADTTTLFVTVHRGADAGGAVIGRGILTIAMEDFLRQLRTMRATNTEGRAENLRAVARFGHFFAGELFTAFGGVFAGASVFNPDAVRRRRDLRVGVPEVHFAETTDGRKLRLTRYKGGDKGPVILSHGLGVSSLIFSIDTIETNLLEYLHALGYDCWLLDYRASIELPYSREFWTADTIAELDYPAAVGRVRALTGAESVQMVVHCFGAMTFFMAMLHGLEGVRSVAVSQIATDADVPWYPQRLLAYLRMPDLMQSAGIGLVDARATTRRGAREQLLDGALGLFYPFRPDDRSRSLTSRRITALYGQLYQHGQLNQATFDALPEMFGVANIGAFQHLSRIARAGHVVGSDGSERYLPHLGRLKLPITFLHGSLNRCFSPSGTRRTLARLTAANGKDWYERHEIPGFGHIDCIFGKNAAKAVYPLIARHLERTP